MSSEYVLDTHAVVHWQRRQRMSARLVETLDTAAQFAMLHVASVSFWEVAFLVRKGRLIIEDPIAWKSELIGASGIEVIDPSPEEMIESTRLPDYHADPFDRLLVAIVRRRSMTLVTADEHIRRYEVDTVWEEN